MFESKFDSNKLFSGGAGIFIEFHDLIKPVYLYAVMSMITTGNNFGIPVDIISHLRPVALIEWYTKRRYRNPFTSLDYNKTMPHDEMDQFLQRYMCEIDNSIYEVAPILNAVKLLGAYTTGKLTVPVYIYSRYNEPEIKTVCKQLFPELPFKYVYGDIKECASLCGNNYSYYISDMRLIKDLTSVIEDKFSCVFLADAYRYNFGIDLISYRHDMGTLFNNKKFRVEMFVPINFRELVDSFSPKRES